MTEKQVKISYIISRIFLMILPIGISFCQSRVVLDENVDAKEKLKQAIYEAKEERDNTIDISNFLDFDTLYIFSPYTYVSDIEEYLKKDISHLNWIQSEKEGRGNLAAVKENETLFVAIKKGAIEAYFTFPRKYGDFSAIRRHVYDKKESSFILKHSMQNDSTTWLYLVD